MPDRHRRGCLSCIRKEQTAYQEGTGPVSGRNRSRIRKEQIPYQEGTGPVSGRNRSCIRKEQIMQVLLTAINAKYIHSCPAVYSLKAASGCPEKVTIAEYTINDRYQDIVDGVLSFQADVIGFSCYIWNARMIHDVIADVREVLGDKVILFAGGPEASCDPGHYLDVCDFVICWEGEKPFRALMQAGAEKLDRTRSEDGPDMSQGRDRLLMSIYKIPGIAYSDALGHLCVNPSGEGTGVELETLPFVYDDPEEFSNRIIYYESSRGCPFHCSYCLSSIDRHVRYRSLEKVLPELQFFLDKQVPQVKFVDRTFNCDRKRALAIWTYLKDHDNGITNFHFEIGADLLDDESIALLRSLRPGLVQLEIGIQSTNPETIKAIDRTMDLDNLFYAVRQVRETGNINLHVDLIAGLPYEGIESFARSFDDVYALHADQLQLGFLKVLRGTAMYDLAWEYDIRYSVRPPYEVLSTRWMKHEELARLHQICDVVDLYYNSQQFQRTLAFLEKSWKSAYAFFEQLADFFREKGYDRKKPSAAARYQVLEEFVLEEFEPYTFSGCQQGFYERFRNYLKFDHMLHFHRSRRMIERGTFDFGEGEIALVFDYSQENPVNHEVSFYEEKQ